jgi:hypothetical protein
MSTIFDYKVGDLTNFFSTMVRFNKNAMENKGDWAKLQISLRSGQVVEGFPVVYEKLRSDSRVLMVDEPAKTDAFHAMSFFGLSEVSSVKICYAHVVSEVLIEGKLGVPIPKDEVPTALKLKRKIKEMTDTSMKEVRVSAELIDAIGPNLGQVKLYYFSLFLDELNLALETVKSDPMGKETLATLDGINLERGDSIKFHKEGNTLKIDFDFSAPDGEYKSLLVDGIEKAL